ncbi:MAG: protein kinase domain-containing protein [Chloroflexota bacterium]
MTPTSLEGQNLGKYRLLEPLGRGGMAQVYRAYHPQLDRYVAVKVLRSDLVEETEFLARFQREARSVAALRHPNIVQVFDADVQDNHYYIVMELLEGDTLKARQNAYRAHAERMPLGETARVMLDVLNGLGYAHEEGIIHRDIKPANILLNRRGQAVLSDFGIAQIVGGTQYTISGALMGTLSYMAPEQGLENRCDPRSDLYSLGIVFYEMLTGRPPFDADTPLAILMKHLNDPLPLPRQINPAIPEAFERVALKALAKNPDDRYQQAHEMAQAIRAATEDTGVAPVDDFAILAPVPAASLPDGAVFSGEEREHITDRRFADDNTDPRLSQHVSSAGDAGLDGVVAAHPPTANNPDVAPGLPTVVIAASTALASRLTRVQEELPGWVAQPQTVPLPQWSVARAAMIGAGVLVLANLCAIWLAAGTGNGRVFGNGWPIEILLAGLLLSLLMAASRKGILLIPAGIVAGTGIVMAFYAITGLWSLWTFCWPAMPLIVGASIAGGLSLAQRGESGAHTVQLLGYGLAALSLFAAAANMFAVAWLSIISFINPFSSNW